jgi:hypothetical protein
MADTETYRDRLLMEILAERLYFDWLSEVLPGPRIYPSYLFVIVGLFIEYGLFDVYNYVVSGKSSFFTQPNSLAIPAMAILGVVGLRYVHDTYADAIQTLGVDDDRVNIDDSTHKNFERLVSLRVRVAGYFVALLIYYAVVVFVLGIPRLIDIGGIGLTLYAQVITFPLIIVPVLVELGISYVAVHFLIPRRIAKADLGLFYYDPRNLGGFGPIGELLKRSYYVYTGILLLWFFQSHAPVILSQFISSPYPPPAPILQVALSAVWFVGVVSIAYSMYQTHSVMKGKKEEKIRSLEQEIKQAVNDPYDATLSNIKDRERYEEAQETLSHVKNTKTYPTTFTMWSQIFISVFLPQALNMVVQLPG